MSRSRRRTTFHEDIPTKANKVLNLVLLALILIGIRIWNLAIVQHDQKLEESRRPQQRVIVEAAKRASIRDRFNIPLAINKVQYQAAILYSQIQQIPSVAWEKDASGKKVKVFRRKVYIAQLAKVLGEELDLDPKRLEDLIYAKAIYYTNVPFIIKEEITEKEFYRLKMLEKEWIGIHVRILPKRFYPQGKVAADVIGYTGAINRQEYETILHEMKALEVYLAQHEEGLEGDLPKGMDSIIQVRKRLQTLKQKAYTIHDTVGKAGVEGRFEEELRGFQGKKSFHSDARGNYLRELPGSREPLPGHRYLLTLSSELQEYAEGLLAQNELLRHVRVTKLGQEKRTVLTERYPWIKGGSIIAMDPNNGEIIALASYPRYDPNDFIASGDPDVQIEQKANVRRWLESESHIADVWNQKRPLIRESWLHRDHKFHEESRYLDWNGYLDVILPPENEVRIALQGMGHIREVIEMQNAIDTLMIVTGQTDLYAIFNALYANNEGHLPYQTTLSSADKTALEARLKENEKEIGSIKKKLAPTFSQILNNYNKVLLVDICRLIADNSRFSPNLLSQVGNQGIPFYHDAVCALETIKKVAEGMAKDLFHEGVFNEWRKDNEKAFLKEKRAWEKASGKYATPYIDYLDKEEESQFHAFWKEHQNRLIIAFLIGKAEQEPEGKLQPYFDLFFNWHGELAQGAHPSIDWRDKYLLLKQALSGMSINTAEAYLQTARSYNDLSRPLFGRYRFLRSGSQQPLEKHLAAAFYPTYGFSYGRSNAYRQATVQGSIFKLVTAYESLVQSFARLGKANPSPSDLNPLFMIDQVYKQGSSLYVGYNQDGKPLPQIYNGGRLPRSQMSHIGPIDIVKALEASSNPYFALLASEYLNDPQDLVDAAREFSYGSRTGIDLPGELAGILPKDLHTNRTGLYAFAIGQHSMIVTPLQTAVMLSALANGGKVLKPKIVSCTAGRQYDMGFESIPSLPIFPHQEDLQAVGIDFPLFTASLKGDEMSSVTNIQAVVKRQLFMPAVVRSMLLQAMRRMVYRTQAEGMASLRRLYAGHPEALADYTALKEEIVGKSSTSEVVERIDLDFDHGVNIYTHVWFGGIAFEHVFHDRFDKPELVVVIYLRYGGFGKEAAPLAAQVVKKWRDIKLKQQKN